MTSTELKKNLETILWDYPGALSTIPQIISLFSSQGDRRQSGERRTRELIGSNRRQRERRVDWYGMAKKQDEIIKVLTGHPLGQCASRQVDLLCIGCESITEFYQMEAERGKNEQ